MPGSCVCRFRGFCKPEQGRSKFLTKQVYFCKTFIGFLIPLFSITVRRLSPWCSSFPCPLIQLPKKNIGREEIAFLSCKSCQPGSHVADHIVTSPAPVNDGIGAGNQCRKRSALQIGSPCCKVRNAIIFKGTLKQWTIIIKTADSDGNISPPAA